jgi:putative redox protein
MPAQIDVTYKGDFRCTARHISAGATATTDVSKAQGGLGENFSPTDLLVVSLGTCILTTMAMVAQRRQLDLAGISACMEKEVEAPPSHRIASIGMTITMPMSLRLTAENRSRLENAAQKCPVKKCLHPDIEIRVEFVYPEGCLLPEEVA